MSGCGGQGRGSPAGRGSEQQGAEPPVATITPSSFWRPLSERDVLSCQLEQPILKQGDQTYPTRKQGSVPYDPECIKIVDTETFRTELPVYEGSPDPVETALPPIDWRCQLFSEDDNRWDLKNKVYLPLSRLLQKHGMAFSNDCKGQIPQGTSDTSVHASDDLATAVVVEEKSESFLQSLLEPIRMTFPQMCQSGRQDFLTGVNLTSKTARFSCPLILAQVLGYMKKDQTAYGLIISSGRAYFVWVVPADDKPMPTAGTSKRRKVGRAKEVSAAKKAQGTDSTQDPGIYLTEAIMINDENFLRILYSFILQAKPTGENKRLGVRVSNQLKTPSSEGGFTRGEAQSAAKSTESAEGQSGKPKGKARKSNTSEATGRASLVCRLPFIPPFKVTKVLADTLGREKIGRVVVTDWHGISAVVKIVHVFKNEHGQKHALRLFESEVTAYDLAGRAGLWDVAVPRPLFVATDERECVLCLAAGHPMPLDPKEWTDCEIFQARESVQLLFNAGIELSDIKPGNFVRTKLREGCVEERVMAIDLEEPYFDAQSEFLELPDWLLRGTRAQAVSP